MPLQIRRTPTVNNPPSGLLPGQLSVEMANTPPRLWVGVPTAINPSGRLQLNDFVTSQQLSDVNSSLMQTLIGLIGAQRLQADTTFYVSNGGLDSNDGATAGTAWLTLQHAWDTIVGHYNLNGYRATINVAAGVYAPLNAQGSAAGNTHGAAGIIINGAGATTTGVVGTNAHAVNAAQGALLTVQNLRFNATGPLASNAGCGLIAGSGAVIAFANVDFIQCEVAHAYAQSQGSIYIGGAYSISGGSNIHLAVGPGSALATTAPSVVTINGTLPINVFALVAQAGQMTVPGMTFVGATTGIKYQASLNGVINTQSGNIGYFPGDQPGTTATGGQYA